MAHDEAAREVIEADVLAALEGCSPEGFNRGPIVRKHVAAGIPQSTVYRIIKDVLESGSPAKHIAKKVMEAEAAAEASRKRDEKAKAKAAAKAAKEAPPPPPPPPPAAESAAVIGEIIAPPMRWERVVASGAIPFAIKITKCIDAIEDILESAQYQEGDKKGKVRLPKLTLTALREYRGFLDTAMKWQEKQADLDRLHAFHEILLGEVAQESPACAERIAARLEAVYAARGGA
jgi:hypothetical protein